MWAQLVCAGSELPCCTRLVRSWAGGAALSSLLAVTGLQSRTCVCSTDTPLWLRHQFCPAGLGPMCNEPNPEVGHVATAFPRKHQHEKLSTPRFTHLCPHLGCG